MSQADVAVVEQFLGAFTSGDVEKAFSLVHPDIVINEAEGLPYPGDWAGLAGFQALLGKIFEKLEMAVEKYEVVDTGTGAMVKLGMKFTSRASGRQIPMPGVELYSVTDGKTSGIDVYYKDTKAVADLVAG